MRKKNSKIIFFSRSTTLLRVIFKKKIIMKFTFPWCHWSGCEFLHWINNVNENLENVWLFESLNILKSDKMSSFIYLFRNTQWESYDSFVGSRAHRKISTKNNKNLLKDDDITICYWNAKNLIPITLHYYLL